MKKEIEKIVTEVTLRKDSLERVTNAPIEFDEKELKRYIDFVIREIRKERNTK